MPHPLIPHENTNGSAPAPLSEMPHLRLNIGKLEVYSCYFNKIQSSVICAFPEKKNYEEGVPDRVQKGLQMKVKMGSR